MSKNKFTEPQRNRNGTANYVNLIRTSTVTQKLHNVILPGLASSNDVTPSKTWS